MCFGEMPHAIYYLRRALSGILAIYVGERAKLITLQPLAMPGIPTSVSIARIEYCFIV